MNTAQIEKFEAISSRIQSMQERLEEGEQLSPLEIRLLNHWFFMLNMVLSEEQGRQQQNDERESRIE
jgi:hypothetical protein